ncbi:MAG: cytidine deaminase, partial [Candidatus Desulforudis sp.]|nr:cytidine deaminase [Desulforudis sp.]
MIQPVSDADLVQRALAAREYAYAPYSGYQVGAAVLTADGRVFTGCNIENSSYGLTVCAERVALLK